MGFLQRQYEQMFHDSVRRIICHFSILPLKTLYCKYEKIFLKYPSQRVTRWSDFVVYGLESHEINEL